MIRRMIRAAALAYRHRARRYAVRWNVPHALPLYQRIQRARTAGEARAFRAANKGR